MQDPSSANEGGQANATPSAEPSKEQAPDLASIKVQVGEGPDGEMTIAQLKSAYDESRRAMHGALQEKHEMKRQYAWADKLETELENPAFVAHLQNFYVPQDQIPEQNIQYDDYGNPITPRRSVSRQSSYSSPIPSKGDIRLNHVETKLHVLSQKEAMSNLASDLKESFGFKLTDKHRTAILEQIANTGNENANDVFWGMFGKEVVKDRSSKVQKEVSEKIKENATAYVNSPSGTTTVPSVDVASMSEAEHENYKLDYISKVLGKGGA